MLETSIREIKPVVQKPPEILRNKPVIAKTVQPIISSDPSIRLGEIREFSKSTEEGRKARQETARKILRQRSGRGKVQEKIESVSQKKEKMINEGKWWKDEQVRQEQEVLALQAELRDRFSSWFLRVREKLRPSSFLSKEGLEREILRRQDRLSEIQSGKTRFEVNYLPLVLKGFDEELRLLTEQREALQNKSKEELRLFYEKFGKELARHKAGIKDLADLELYRRKEGTVQSLAERFNTYFVHAFSLYPGGRNNALLSGKHNLTWREKLFIEVVEKPAISASTISGDYPRDLWSPIGVFLGSGIVVDAEYQDMATRVNRMGKKEPKFAHPKNIGQYEEKITRAITSRLLQFGNEFRQWNEVILDDKPRPVGFFVNLDQKSYGQGAHHQSVGALSFSEQGLHLKSIYPSDKAAYPELKRDLYYTEIFDAANFVGLKVFAMKDGIAYEASLDSDGRLILGRSVSPNEMITMKAEIPPENLPKVREVINQFLVTNGTSMEIAMM